MNIQPEAAWELHLFFTGLRIPYAIIGGMAVQHWGEPRLTQDVDVTIFVPLENPTDTIQEIVGRFSVRIADAVAFARRNRVILVQANNGCPVDISLGLPGYEEKDFILPLFRALEWDTRNSVEVSASTTRRSRPSATPGRASPAASRPWMRRATGRCTRCTG